MNELLLKLLVGVPAITLLFIFLGLLYHGLDRKIRARMQWREGPPITQPFYDVRKLLTKKNLVPENAITWLFHSAPFIAIVAAVLAVLYIPIGSMNPVLEGYGDLIIVIYLLAAPPLAMSIGGFASGAPFASLGSQREITLMMSYELPLAIVVATVAFIVGGETAFSLATIADANIWSLVGPIGLIGLIILLITMIVVSPAKLAKVPFDISKAKTEISGGTLSEYSGRNLAMFYIADGVKTVAIMALLVAIFFPWNLSPVIGITGAAAIAVDFLFFLLKLLILMVVIVTFVRTAFARIKIDQFSRNFVGLVSTLALVGLILVMVGA
ncbi:respiratory chain complex I subunit 1 family protein [Methanonatronarchaeum sp. AMET6-2]|uniref:respiratory chain complex I subunit 1 family protein n=1 Tax=Methanonatronarchaeum sp. AMET6-2 TaxID=2933293 RepID=UPI00121E8C59|nr:complex I subunit 1 family protein [Methanonatronarchaeum sp. AMET6-2]RZN61147.1 MAG: NADH-quinone oxidoreductase subunit H [Methanonatronarchaeia archaeon]UOY09794.1 NADH-quinone oxidoreductase subunit H [Methanonatronarchaeum sp. AMET6-2]